MEQHSVCEAMFFVHLAGPMLASLPGHAGGAGRMAEQPRSSLRSDPVYERRRKCFIVVLILPAKSRCGSVSRFLLARLVGGDIRPVVWIEAGSRL